jgi:alkylation response protein AidB-like acyl-CoA dehydrogenase
MRWTLTENQELVRDSFRGWLERFAPAPAVRGWLDACDSTEFERRFAAEGWFAVGSPEDCGGQGGGLLELALVAEQLGRAAAPSAAWLATVLAVPALDGRRELASAALADGEFAVLVADASGPFDAVGGPAPVRAEQDVLRGTVARVLGADRARTLIVPAGTAGGLGLFVVDAADAGITPRRLVDRSRTVADVTLSGVRGHRLEADAKKFLARAALRAAVLTAADSLGAAERMLELAVEHSKQRHQFGVPIGSFQAVKHAAATMLVAVESARSIAYFAAASVDQGHPDAAVHAAAAKAQVSTSAAYRQWRPACVLRRDRAGCRPGHHPDHHLRPPRRRPLRGQRPQVWISKAAESEKILLLTRGLQFPPRPPRTRISTVVQTASSSG